MPKAAGTLPAPPPAVAQALARLSRYPSLLDIEEAFGARDPLLDAYVQGWLPLGVVEVVEANPPKLQCWLLARLLRLHLARPA